MTFLKLGDRHNWLNDKFPLATGCSYKSDAYLEEKNASVKKLKHSIDYSAFEFEVGGNKVAGVHVHCDSYGPWGAFEKTVKLLTDAKSSWPLQTIFVVGCCGASISEEKKKDDSEEDEEKKKDKTWCGIVLLANEVKSYLHTGKAETCTDANASESVIIKGQAKSYVMEDKWLEGLKSMAQLNVTTGFNNIEVMKTVYLSGPLVIKNQLFGDKYRSGDIAGVEMEVIGVIQAVDAIHHYTGPTFKRPEIVLVKGISDYTCDKKKEAKCVFFGNESKELFDDDSRQVYATLQSIALVMRCVANFIEDFS